MKILAFRILLLSFLVIQADILLAQGGQFDEQKKIKHRNEKTFAFNLNSNGWGLNYQYGKRIDARKKWIYGGNFNVMKHPKEKKQLSNSITGGRFVYGKDNYAFNLQAAVGRQKEFFRKRDKGSVSIRGFYLVGATLAVMKPMYYEIILKDDLTIHERYDPSFQSVFIVGRSPFYKGLDETTILPGAYIKAGFSFEYSKYDQKIRAIDVGAKLSIYPKEVRIMAETSNSRIFPVVFLSWRFGKVVSGHNFDEAEKIRRSEMK